MKSELTLKRIVFGKKGKNGKQQFRYFIEDDLEDEEEGEASEETEQVLPFSELETEEVEGLPEGAIHILKLPFIGSFMVSTEMRNGMPVGSLVWQDPFLQYINEAAKRSEEPKAVYVAKDSQAICLVFPLINSIEKLESLHDTGSQIVLMSEHIAD